MKSFDFEKECQILTTLQSMGIDTGQFNFCLKAYSSTCRGRYYPDSNTVYVYAVEEYRPDGTTVMYTFQELVLVAIHEACHAMQYHDPQWERKKGVMHDEAFYKMYNSYAAVFNRVIKEISNEGIYSDEQLEKIVGSSYILTAQNRYGGFTAINASPRAVGSVPTRCVALKRGKLPKPLRGFSSSRISV